MKMKQMTYMPRNKPQILKQLIPHRSYSRLLPGWRERAKEHMRRLYRERARFDWPEVEKEFSDACEEGDVKFIWEDSDRQIWMIERVCPNPDGYEL